MGPGWASRDLLGPERFEAAQSVPGFCGRRHLDASVKLRRGVKAGGNSWGSVAQMCYLDQGPVGS